MSLEPIVLGDLVDSGEIDIQTGPFGTQLRASDYTTEGTPVINVRNVGYGNLRTEQLEYVPIAVVDRLKKHVIEKNDIVFGRKGAVDRHLLVTDSQSGWMQGSDCIRIRVKSPRLMPEYLSRALCLDTHKRWMITQCSNKATMASLNQDVICRIPIILQEPSVQRKVVSILSAYDDLIENNRRRIKLLEQAARLLYREWFVNLRFPGHEHTKIIDGVPEGWGKKTAFEVMDVLSGGTPRTTNPSYWSGEIPFFTPKDATDFAYVHDTEKFITNVGLKNCNSKLYPKETVFITARGTVGKINLAQRPMAMNQSCYALIAYPPLDQKFLYFALVDGVEQFRSRAVGAVFDAIVRDTFKLIPFIVPERKMISAFEVQVSPMLAQINNLSGQIRSLRKARNLLLPKLMQGEVAV